MSPMKILDKIQSIIQLLEFPCPSLDDMQVGKVADKVTIMETDMEVDKVAEESNSPVGRPAISKARRLLVLDI